MFLSAAIVTFAGIASNAMANEAKLRPTVQTHEQAVSLAKTQPPSSTAYGPRVAPALPNLAVPQETIDSFVKLEEKKRLHILVNLIKAKQHEAAAKLIANVPFQGKFGRNRNIFIQGLIEKARGNLDQAAQLYRTALADDPGLSMVRMELAATLFAMNEHDGARHHLNLLKSAAPTPELARNFNDFIAAIDEKRPWSFNVYAAIAPSTNFTNGTTEEVIFINGLPFVISGESRKKSGIGVKGGANAGYRVDITNDLAAIVGGGVNFTQYDSNTFDTTTVNQNIELRRNHSRGSVGLGVITSQAWYGASEFLWSAGPQITIRHALMQNLVLDTRFSHLWTFYKDATYRDGTTSNLTNRLALSLSEARVLYAMAGAERLKTDIEHNSYTAGWAGLGIYQEMPYGLTVYAEGKARYSVSDGDYPLLGEKLEQTRVDGRLTLTKRDFSIFGLAPQLEYTYTRNFSNNTISRYDAHGLALTVTRAF